MTDSGSTDVIELPQRAALLQLQSMFHDCVAQNARDVLFVHAGAIAWENAAIIFPGRTMSGKTTVVAEMVAAGAKYLSDEFAVITVEGLVSPYVKPLSVRDSTGRSSLMPVDDIGGVPASMPVPAKAVVQTNFMPGVTWQPEYLSPGQTLMALLDNTVAVREVPEFTMKLLGNLARHTVGLAGPRGEASQFVRRLQKELAKL